MVSVYIRNIIYEANIDDFWLLFFHINNRHIYTYTVYVYIINII